MAYSLNTNHPLYPNIVELIGVKDGALISHKTARTFTKHADATYGSGAYGEHFSSIAAGYTAKNATFSPAIVLDTYVNTNYAVVVVVNSSGSVGGGASSFLARVSGGEAIRAPGKNDAGDVTGYGCTGGAIGNGAAMLTYCRIGETARKLYINKTKTFDGTNLGPEYNSTDARADEICGWEGQNSITSDLVWLVVLNKELSQAEVDDLYDSLGPDNAFALIESQGSNSTPVFNGPNISDDTATVGVPLTSIDVSGKFYDTDSLTFSAIGSWPPGVTVSSVGVISGTPTTQGVYSGLSVRATDTVGQSHDSNSFTFTVNAAPNVGTITISSIKELTTGALRVGETGITVIVNDIVTGDLVVKKTGQTSDGVSANCLISDNLITPGTWYRVTTVLSDGSEGTWKYQAE